MFLAETATGNATAEVFSAWNGDTATATIHGLYSYVRRIAEHCIVFLLSLSRYTVYGNIDMDMNV